MALLSTQNEIPASHVSAKGIAPGAVLSAQSGTTGAVFLSPNFVQYVNPNAPSAANSLSIAAPSISPQGTGIYEVSASACPYPTGEPSTITAQLYRDSTPLTPKQVPIPSGPGDHTPLVMSWIDSPGDGLPHIYSMVQTPSVGQIADLANHQWIHVREL
jgi:hypothetical protein